MKKLGMFLSTTLVATLALTACSGAGGNSAAPTATVPAPTLTPPTATAALGPQVTVDLELSDSSLTPTTMTVPLGAQVTFNVKNTRTDVRDCIFRDLTTIKLFPGQSQWNVTDIAAGTTESYAFVAPTKPATYQVDCGLTGFSGSPREPAAGLVAKFDVK